MLPLTLYTSEEVDHFLCALVRDAAQPLGTAHKGGVGVVEVGVGNESEHFAEGGDLVARAVEFVGEVAHHDLLLLAVDPGAGLDVHLHVGIADVEAEPPALVLAKLGRGGTAAHPVRAVEGVVDDVAETVVCLAGGVVTQHLGGYKFDLLEGGDLPNVYVNHSEAVGLVALFVAQRADARIGPLVARGACGQVLAGKAIVEVEGFLFIYHSHHVHAAVALHGATYCGLKRLRCPVAAQLRGLGQHGGYAGKLVFGHNGLFFGVDVGVAVAAIVVVVGAGTERQATYQQEGAGKQTPKGVLFHGSDSYSKMKLVLNGTKRGRVRNVGRRSTPLLSLRESSALV